MKVYIYTKGQVEQGCSSLSEFGQRKMVLNMV